MSSSSSAPAARDRPKTRAELAVAICKDNWPAEQLVAVSKEEPDGTLTVTGTDGGGQVKNTRVFRGPTPDTDATNARTRSNVKARSQVLVDECKALHQKACSQCQRMPLKVCPAFDCEKKPECTAARAAFDKGQREIEEMAKSVAFYDEWRNSTVYLD